MYFFTMQQVRASLVYVSVLRVYVCVSAMRVREWRVCLTSMTMNVS